MLSRILPAVDSKFSTSSGEYFTVIGTGTQGVIVEYIDGRVAVISSQEWQSQAGAFSSIKKH